MSVRSPRLRDGFTIIEMLVVVAIIGMLIGLLLPAVQSTRELARSTSCQNNLLQLQLATATYHHAFGCYPAGTVTDRLPARLFADGKDHSWLVQIRPFLSGGREFDEQWSPAHSSYHPRNWPLAKLGSTAMTCPSSPVFLDSGVVPLSFAGVHDGLARSINDSSRGFFVANKFLRTRDVSDGLSYTLAISEIWVDPGRSFLWLSGNQSTLRSTGVGFLDRSNNAFYEMQSRSAMSTAYGRFRDPPEITYPQVADYLEEHYAGPDASDHVAAAIAALAYERDPEGESDGFGMDGMGMELSDSNESWSAANANSLIGQPHPQLRAPPFPVPTVGVASAAPMGFASHHPMYVNGIFADGRIVAINYQMDPVVLSQIGVRDDQRPLSKPLVESGP